MGEKKNGGYVENCGGEDLLMVPQLDKDGNPIDPEDEMSKLVD